MLLNSREIEQAIRQGIDLRVEPYNAACIQPSSLDVHLGDQVRVPLGNVQSIDTADVPENHTTLVNIAPGTPIILEPGAFLLGCTQEVVQLGANLAAHVEGRSSLGRLGLAVHVTAGLVDPGFAGQITLEIVNHAPWSLTLWPGMRIAQLSFARVGPGGASYSGAYQNQLGPVESRFTLQVP